MAAKNYFFFAGGKNRERTRNIVTGSDRGAGPCGLVPDATWVNKIFSNQLHGLVSSSGVYQLVTDPQVSFRVHKNLPLNRVEGNWIRSTASHPDLQNMVIKRAAYHLL
jgi:hypothetical protein